MTDKFFTQRNCDRCGKDLSGGRTMSWFTEECICMECKEKERELKKQLNKKGVDTRSLEGCGYIPKE
jgi:hypothetical protein